MWSLNEIGVMAVEENLRTAKQAKHWNISRILVTEDHIIGSIKYGNDECEIESPDNGKQYVELVEQCSWQKITMHYHL